jgi:mannose-6-phosphate isomerase
MGTHVTSPSRVASTNQLLSGHLKANPGLLGEEVIQRFKAGNGDLPFLFKLLSIEKSLSIQTHPDKEMAKRLHEEKPGIYKGYYYLSDAGQNLRLTSIDLDSNHKPEMALAITPFTGLCGFLPIPQIVTYLHSTPELASLIPDSVRNHFLVAASHATASASQDVKDALRSLFSTLMTADEMAFAAQLEKLVVRYTAGQAVAEEQSLVDLVLKLNNQFPNDIGVFCPFLLNHVELQPGEAIFLSAGEPHTYVSGGVCNFMM